MRHALPLVVGVLLLEACTRPDAASASNDITATSCEARFRYWQKDAYRETAGRDFPYWPVHTTTELQVVCDGETLVTRSMPNHGTDVGQLDANGEVILVETREAMVARGSKVELLALVDAYATCSCDDATTFLSLDTVGETLGRDLRLALEEYLREQLECSSDLDVALAAIQRGDLEGGLAAIEACTWKDGGSFAEGLDTAAAALASTASQKLDDYHVCNNDAELQADLFDRFRSSAVVSPCNAGSALCRRPTWFYEP
jgi:hypothetical protein